MWHNWELAGPAVEVGLSSFVSLLLLLFEKGFKILATEYSEFLDSVHSDGENPTEAEYDYIRMFRNEPNPNGHL